jgi:hypothetical protein
MRWVRRHRARGACLALAALLLQIVVSFGHADLDGAVGGGHLTLGATYQLAVATSPQHSPAQNTDADDGYCPICASIFLVSTSFVSIAPQLPVPRRFGPISHSVPVARGIAPSLRLAFRSRAPPLV